MTDSLVTTIQMPPQDFWGLVLAFVLITGILVTYIVLSSLGKPYRPPSWEQESTLTIAIVMGLGVLWLALFSMTIWAAFLGTYQMMHPSAGSSIGLGGLGLGTLLAGLLGAPFLIWSTVIKHRALGFQKEGHLTDRISAAVEQLGAEKTVKKDDKETTVPNIEVRIGGILSLERIAQDSTAYDKGRDHVRVMEILCAYIRHNAPASEAQGHGFGEWEPLRDQASEEERAVHMEKRERRFWDGFADGQVRFWAQNLPEPRADIAIALRVIGRRTPAQRLAEARWGKDAGQHDPWVFETPSPILADDVTSASLRDYDKVLWSWRAVIDGYKGYRLDLSGTNLQRADLSDLVLSGANLIAARMEGADLKKARLEGAKLMLSRMEGADLYRVRMGGAHLKQARMEGADLRHARMVGANLFRARLEGANLGEARLAGADLGSARMEMANLTEASMEGVDLECARMEGANLSEARLAGANLGAAWIVGAELREALISSTTVLTGARVEEVAAQNMDFSMVSISAEQIISMFGDASVSLPNGVNPNHPDWPAHWPKFHQKDFLSEWLEWQSDPSAYIPPVKPDPND